MSDQISGDLFNEAAWSSWPDKRRVHLLAHKSPVLTEFVYKR